MDRLQVNVRLTVELIEAIDQRRIAMQPSLGRIPNRSEIIREVLEASLRPTISGPEATKPPRKK